MEFLTDLLTQPFALGLLLGLCVGLFLLALSILSHFRTKREFRRYKQHLSDKMEIEAKAISDLQKEKSDLGETNERLRIQVAQLSEKPDAKLHRELEILARAEKQLMVSAPGFAGAWETAKGNAQEELGAEAKGESMPKRIFRRFLGGAGGGSESKEVAEALEMKVEEAEPESEGESS